LTKATTIAIDAMGGDHAPLEIIRGAVLAARDLQVKIILTGKKDIIEAILHQEEGCCSGLDIEIVDAPDDIPMDEKNPARAVKRGAKSSVVVANKLVAEGRADAVIAAGHTGAATAASLFELGRIEGFERPCICTLIPTHSSRILLIDAGSNIEATAEQMHQTAILGNILAKILLSGELCASRIMKEQGLRAEDFLPKIGLLNVGEEPGKGTTLYKDTYDLLKNESRIDFVGNVEGKTIIDNVCDVVICDGFTGNIHLKALEGGLRMMSKSFEREFKNRGLLSKIAALILKLSGTFDRIKDHFDPSSYGGALLGGLNGVSLISHGSSNAEAIKNACKHAQVLVSEGVVGKIKNSF
jgi:phosphate acyltransferase